MVTTLLLETNWLSLPEFENNKKRVINYFSNFIRVGIAEI